MKNTFRAGAMAGVMTLAACGGGGSSDSHSHNPNTNPSTGGDTSEVVKSNPYVVTGRTGEIIRATIGNNLDCTQPNITNLHYKVPENGKYTINLTDYISGQVLQVVTLDTRKMEKLGDGVEERINATADYTCGIAVKGSFPVQFRLKDISEKDYYTVDYNKRGDDFSIIVRPKNGKGEVNFSDVDVLLNGQVVPEDNSLSTIVTQDTGSAVRYDIFNVVNSDNADITVVDTKEGEVLFSNK